jgi:hypothetical protein
VRALRPNETVLAAAVPVVALVVLVAFAGSEEPRYCARLEARARDVATQERLRAWVREHVAGKPIRAKDALSSDGVGPGDRLLNETFDGAILGYGEGAHARVVGPDPADWLADAATDEVDSVFFTERSRYGVLVRLPGRASFGLVAWMQPQLRPVSEDLAVLCVPRD